MYRENDTLKQNFDSIFKKYGGFLAISPSNTPIRLKIRIYILKATINVVGAHKPYLCINLGDKIHDTSYGFEQNNVEKEFFFAK
jgi:hypothetical protein